jgi:hypothetical protein
MRKQVEAARKAHDKIMQAIYALAPNGHTPFSECRKLASLDLQAKLDAAQSKIIDLEYKAVAAGKAWRASFGMLVWNR